MAAETFALDLPEDYSLEQTVWLLRRTKNNLVDMWHERRYIRALQTSAGPCIVAVEQRQPAAAEVRVSGLCLTSCVRHELSATLRRMLGLDLDISALARRFDADPRLRELPSNAPGMRPPRFPTLFETIASVVPFQQLSLAAGVAVLGRLVQQLGQRLSVGGKTAWLFPAAETIASAAPAVLRSSGMSAVNCATLRSTAQAIVGGDIGEDLLEALPTLELIKVLDDLPGIGPWSAALIALRGLGRLDSFPPEDSGVRRSLGSFFGGDAPLDAEDERRMLEELGPARGLLYFYTLAWRLRQQGAFAVPGL